MQGNFTGPRISLPSPLLSEVCFVPILFLVLILLLLTRHPFTLLFTSLPPSLSLSLSSLPLISPPLTEKPTKNLSPLLEMDGLDFYHKTAHSFLFFCSYIVLIDSDTLVGAPLCASARFGGVTSQRRWGAEGVVCLSVVFEGVFEYSEGSSWFVFFLFLPSPFPCPFSLPSPPLFSNHPNQTELWRIGMEDKKIFRIFEGLWRG